MAVGSFVQSVFALTLATSATQMVLAQTLNRMMRLLHPFAPFITEELFAKLPIHTSSLILAQYPTPENDKAWLSIGSVHAKLQMEMVKEVITAVRTIRGESQIKPNQEITVRIAANDPEAQKILKANQAEIMRLGRISKLEIGDIQLLQKSAVATIKVENFLFLKISIFFLLEISMTDCTAHFQII